MSKGEITQKSEISKLLGAKPVLPGENADEYAAGLAALIAELDAKTVLQIYLAEKIYDCLWWIRRYEAQKRMVMIAQMAEIVQDHYLAKSTIDAVELREALRLDLTLALLLPILLPSLSVGAPAPRRTRL